MTESDIPVTRPSGDAQVETLGDTLRTSEQNFRRQFGSAPCGMVATSLDVGRAIRILAANDTYCQQTGYAWAELSGKDLLADIHPEDQPALDTMISYVAAGHTSRFGVDTRVVRPDGQIVYVRLTGEAINSGAGRYLVTYAENVTPVQDARAELRQVEAELARSRRFDSLGHLAGGIAHDFNNLLTVIANYASLVRDEITVAEAAEGTSRWEPARADVQQIEDAADRAKRLIKHLTAFARREQAEPILVDLGQQIPDSTALLRDVLGDNVQVIAMPGAGLWPVQIDPGMLEQAIVNIAVNARDAMPAGGQITITVDNVDTTNAASLSYPLAEASELTELVPGRYVALRISDTGTGMDSVIVDRAFEPFFTTKNGDQAAGLGLSAVRRIAARAGGHAWLRSRPGLGTTVTLMLPAAADVEPQVAAQPTQASAGSILVVDDEAAIREVAHRVLTSAAYHVITATNGHDAIRLLQDRAVRVDLVLSDVVMPGMTAREFVTRVTELCPGIRMLFMSGYERPEGEAQGWPDPRTEVISKPFSRAALLVTISRAMSADVGRVEIPAQRGSHHAQRL